MSEGKNLVPQHLVREGNALPFISGSSGAHVPQPLARDLKALYTQVALRQQELRGHTKEIIQSAFITALPSCITVPIGLSQIGSDPLTAACLCTLGLAAAFLAGRKTIHHIKLRARSKAELTRSEAELNEHWRLHFPRILQLEDEIKKHEAEKREQEREQAQQRSARLHDSAVARLREVMRQRAQDFKPMPAAGELVMVDDPDAPEGPKLPLRIAASGIQHHAKTADYCVAGQLHAACAEGENPWATPALSGLPDIVVKMPEPLLLLPSLRPLAAPRLLPTPHPDPAP